MMSISIIIEVYSLALVVKIDISRLRQIMSEIDIFCHLFIHYIFTLISSKLDITIQSINSGLPSTPGVGLQIPLWIHLLSTSSCKLGG